MPCVHGKISGLKLTEEIIVKLETEITKALQEEISLAFPAELGFVEGTEEFEICHQIAHKIMPGWTWITVEEARWAVRGVKCGDDKIVARFHILVLANALFTNFRQKVVRTVEHTLTRIFSEYGKPVQLFVDCIEGEVDLTLPEDLFGELLKGEDDSLLTPSDVVQFIMKKVINEIKPK